MENKQILDTMPITKYKDHAGFKDMKIFRILEKQHYKCNYCSAVAIDITVFYDKQHAGLILYISTINSKGQESRMTVDHILPKSKGGKNHYCNNQILCQKCNQKKADKIIRKTKHVK